MAEEKKEENSRVLRFSLVFLVIFTMVFSLGVVAGKNFIPEDGPVPAERSPGLLQRLVSFVAPKKTPIEESTVTQDEKDSSALDKYLSAMINPDHKYTIQVSSFLSRKIANRTARFYKNRGYPAFIREYSPSEIATFYRVRIGSFQSKEQARKYGNEMKKKERDFKFYVTVND